MSPVESSARTCDVLTLQHVKWLMKEDVIEIEADSAIVGATQRKTGIEIIVGGDAGNRLYRAERIVGENAGEILNVVSGEHKTGRAVITGGLERARGDIYRIGAGQIVRTHYNFEILRLPGL